MATKNFEQMSTKKLSALYGTATEEVKAQIRAELEKRGEMVESVLEELTPEEKEIIKVAEANGGNNPNYEKPAKAKRLTDEERHELAEKCKENVYHRCQAVPFNSVEWVDGYIAGVIEEKRTNKVLYAIKTDGGQRIVKVSDSKLIRILDEVVAVENRPRRGKTKMKEEITPEALAEELSAVVENVGKLVVITKFALGENGEKQSTVFSGRITGLVPDKRSGRVLYRISIANDSGANIIMHRVAGNNEGFDIEGFDSEGEELNAKYRAKREAAIARASVTPQDRVQRCEENLRKAEEKLRKAQEEIEAKRQQLADAQTELNAYLNAQAETEPLA